jgi:alanine racemase
MVRLGIGLYGFGTCPGFEEKLRNVSVLKSIVTQVKKIRKGESVGYDRSYTATSDMVSATIPIGYADGFDRRLGNGTGKVFINGKPAPVIGNVCMDMTMVDVTGLQVKEGDEVVIFDGNFTVADMARLTGTIPYEVMTSISRRVKRVYYQE